MRPVVGRSEIQRRVKARRGEIEETLLTRVYAISEPSKAPDSNYADGLRAAIPVALDYALAAVGGDGEHTPPVPAALLAQARVAARNGVCLETVLRRYFAGYALLSDFIVKEAAEADLPGPVPRRVLLTLSAVFDHLIAAVGEEHARAALALPADVKRRRAQRVAQLLAGEPIDMSDLRYNFEAHHLGIVGAGAGAERAVRELAVALDRSLLLVCPDRDSVWAWLAGKGEPRAAALGRLASGRVAEGAVLAIGEPAEGLSGWRLTHSQAAAALPIAVRLGQRLARYRDVALLASVSQDDLLATSLRQLYLAPLEDHRDGGDSARATLRAYFDAGRNVSSTAAALGVSRRTVTSRLGRIERQLRVPLRSECPQLEVALRHAELARHSAVSETS